MFDEILETNSPQFGNPDIWGRISEKNLDPMSWSAKSYCKHADYGFINGFAVVRVNGGGPTNLAFYITNEHLVTHIRQFPDKNFFNELFGYYTKKNPKVVLEWLDGLIDRHKKDASAAGREGMVYDIKNLLDID